MRAAEARHRRLDRFVWRGGVPAAATPAPRCVAWDAASGGTTPIAGGQTFARWLDASPVGSSASPSAGIPNDEIAKTGEGPRPRSEGPERVSGGAAPHDNPFEAVEPIAPAPDRQNLRLVIAGDVVTGLGIGGFLLMAAGLVVRSNGLSNATYAAQRGDDADYRAANDRADLGSTLAITGGVTALVLVTTGVALIVTGRRRERRRREAMETMPPASGSTAP